jgi:hypothetical protein
MPDGTTQTDVRMENKDVWKVGFHPPITEGATEKVLQFLMPKN